MEKAPDPESVKEDDVEEAKDQAASEHERVIRPGVAGIQVDGRDHDGPGQDPAEVGDEGLIQVPGRTGGEQDGGKLGGERVEDITPVDRLPHVLGDGGHGVGL